MSFAAVVRERLAFSFENELTEEEEALLKWVTEEIIAISNRSVATIDKMIKRIDETHEILEASKRQSE